jgi:hypothetical protein
MCTVLRCQQAAVTNYPLTTKGPLLSAPVCKEHKDAMDAGEPWRARAEDQAILMGKDIKLAGSQLAVSWDGFSRDLETSTSGGPHMLRARFTGDDGEPITVMMNLDTLRALVESAEVQLEFPFSPS